MLILGLADGQTSGACVVHDGRIISAVNEERIVRLKQARGFPRESIREALRLAGVEPSEIGAVAVSDLRMKLREDVDAWPGWFEARAESRDGVHDLFFHTASRLGGIVPFVPGIKRVYYGLRAPYHAQRRRRIRDILRDEFGFCAPVRFFHHHYAHAASAYHTSGFDDALVVTMDGGGDGHCSHVYSVRNGDFERLSTTDSYDSLGNYYAYVTALCGFKAKRHEGKITGLAARGDPVYRELFESLIGCEDGRLINKGRVLFNSALDRLRASLPEGWSHADLAATIQVVAEEVATSLLRHWLQVTGHSQVALAGGVFANVRINEEILDLEGVERVFVHPGMSDEGLGVGAALALSHEAARRRGRRIEPQVLSTVHLGTEIDESLCEDALRATQLEFESPRDVAAHTARLLHEGHVVARATGKLEYGPRALGNRSIMYRADDPTVNDWLNELLQRTEFMPFAPASLDEYSDELYLNAAGGRETARFMTTTFHCTDWMCEFGAGVVHVDGTARPQLVRELDNPGFYAIIDEYRKLSGFPAVINTSFNVHEEPIVRTAEDAVKAFLDSDLDYLQLGPFVAKGPVGTAGARKRWEGRSVWAAHRPRRASVGS
jgi:carbamoyltransferase